MNSPVSQAAEFPASTQSVLREPAPLPASKKVWHNPMMVPLRPVASRHRWFLGFCFFVLFFALWALVTFTGLVSPTFLASPASMLQEGGLLFTDFDFTTDIGMTVMRVLGGFILACIIAVPLGILMGSYKLIEAFFEPFVSFCRYLPASAFVPLLILWAGIGEMQKILVIFIGSFFQITLMVAVAVGAARSGGSGVYPWRDQQERGASGDNPRGGAGNCGTAAPGAGLGMDLCHRGGTDWFIQRDRSHDCQ